MHPWAWWAWAIGLGLAVSGTTNPLLLSLIGLAMMAVVLARRSAAGWAKSLRAYLTLALVVICIRVGFQVVFGVGDGQTVLFTLPLIPMPDWAAGFQLGGPVALEGLVASLFDAFRLAAMLLCVGAANALANPRSALRSVPAALYEVSVAVVIALSMAPQLIESFQRVRKARRLRGDAKPGLAGFPSIAMPVLTDAVERSISLAASMESRGFARTRGLPIRGVLPVMLASALAATSGVFGLLSGNNYPELSLALLGCGILGTAWGLRRAGRQLRVTTYRPQVWRWTDSLIAGAGAAAAALMLVVGRLNPAALRPVTDPLTWPELTPPMLLVVALTISPLWITIEPRRQAVRVNLGESRRRNLRPRIAPTPELARQ